MVVATSDLLSTRYWICYVA